MTGAQPALRAIALSKAYGKRLAVDHLDLQVDRGELFGFLGPNGAGKTTTIRMALGLIAPTNGSIEILGSEVRHNRSKVLPRVGALVESPALYGYLSGRNNPDLLILDEPANGLDPAGIVEMRDLLRGLAAEGKTVFVSSHVLSEIQQICNRVAIINHGKLIRLAPVTELLDSPGEFE